MKGACVATVPTAAPDPPGSPAQRIVSVLRRIFKSGKRYYWFFKQDTVIEQGHDLNFALPIHSLQGIVERFIS